jgi:hypothetical protein
MSDASDDVDEEEIWRFICNAAARRAGISVERAESILEDAGYHAYGHTGVVDAVEIVLEVVCGPAAAARFIAECEPA